MSEAVNDEAVALAALHETFGDASFVAPFEELVVASRSTLYRTVLKRGQDQQPVVCKIHREGRDTLEQEAAAMQAVHALGYPAPELILFRKAQAGASPSLIMMSEVKGWPFVRYTPILIVLLLVTGVTVSAVAGIIAALVFNLGLAWMYAGTWRRLHNLPVTAFAATIGAGQVGYGAWFNSLAARAQEADAGLAELFGKLAEMKPASHAEVICHGDFHFWNVLCRPFVRGVIDWEEAVIADREFDLAWFSAVNEWMDLPDANDDRVGSIVARLFYVLFSAQLKLVQRAYGWSRQLDDDLMRYYTAVHLAKGLVVIAEAEASGNAWEMRTMKQRLWARLAEAGFETPSAGA